MLFTLGALVPVVVVGVGRLTIWRDVHGGVLIFVVLWTAAVFGAYMVLRYTGREKRYQQGERLGRRIGEWQQRRKSN